MKKALIIGGKGKVGMYLVPMLAAAGWELVNVSRGKIEPYLKDSAWDRVTQSRLDRNAPGFEEKIAEIKVDVVVDMICFKNEDMIRLINAIRDKVSHYLVTGSMWMHGHSAMVPVKEEECRVPLEEYGIQKELMDKTIASEFRTRGFPGTVIHPGHIVCPGDIPINPQGYKSLEAFKILKEEKPLYLPNFGMETLHHVHARDVAALFFAAIQAERSAFGDGFHAVSPRAVTLKGYAEEVANWYGKKAVLRFEPFETWKSRVSPVEAEETLTHIQHSPCGSMEKAERVLGFRPQYNSYEAIRECLGSFGL
jgi:nucleoside-diphosphate-sugar epimerase